MDLLQSIPGPYFLLGYILYVIILMLIARTVFFASGPPAESLTGLDMISIAYLKGGPRGVIQTVFFDLWNREYLDLDSRGQIVIKNGQVPLNALETTVSRELLSYTSASIALSKPTPSTLQNLAPYLDPIARNLESHGLLMSEEARTRQRCLKYLFLGLGLLPGLLKAYLGFTNNRPSVFLILALLIYTIVAFILMRARKGPTSQAKQYIQGLASQYNSELSLVKSGQRPNINPAVLAAIFGVGALTVAYSPLMNLFPGSSYAAYGCTSTWSSSGCSGCSSSSGCSGSSGCSSSGCGGGGCGGCGGGD